MQLQLQLQSPIMQVLTLIHAQRREEKKHIFD